MENIVGQIVEITNRYEIEWSSFLNRARRNFDAVGLEQMSTTDKAKLERLGRFPYEWNQLISQWKALTGSEISNRTNLKATPYGKKDAALAGVHSTVLNFFCNKANWAQARSDAFSSAIIAMLGWRYLSFIPTHDFPDGRPDIQAVSIFDVLPDPDCSVQDWDDGGNAIIYRRKLTAQGVLNLCVDEESRTIVENNIKLSHYDKRDDGKPQLWAKFLRYMGWSTGDKNSSWLNWYDPDNGMFWVAEYHDRRQVDYKYFREIETRKRIEIPRKRQKDDKWIESEKLDYEMNGKPVEVLNDNKEEFWLAIVCPSLCPDRPLYEEPYVTQGKGFALKATVAYKYDPSVKKITSVIDHQFNPQKAYNKVWNTFLDLIVRLLNPGYKIKRESVEEKDLSTWEAGMATGANSYYSEGDAPQEKAVPTVAANLMQTFGLMNATNIKETSAVSQNYQGQMQSTNESGDLFNSRVQQTELMQQGLFNNLNESDKRCGRFFHRMIQEQVQIETEMRITDVTNEESLKKIPGVELQQGEAFLTVNEVNPQDGSILNNLSEGVYDIELDTAQATTTAKQMFLQQGTQILNSFKDDSYAKILLMPMIIGATDHPEKDKFLKGFEEYRDISRTKLLASNAVAAVQIKESEKRMEEMDKPQPPPPDKPPSITLNYKDVPDDVKREIEAKSGLQPSNNPLINSLSGVQQ